MSQNIAPSTTNETPLPLTDTNLSLVDRMDDPPVSLPLLDCISPTNESNIPLPPSDESTSDTDSDYEAPALEYPIHPTLGRPVHPEMMTWPGPEITGRTGEYYCFKEGILNHSLYGRRIHLPNHAYELPQYIRFTHDFMEHQHFVFATHELGQSDPNCLANTPYGWNLEAAIFPSASQEEVDNNNLTNLLDGDLITPVSAALYTIDDPGLTADVDCLQNETHVRESLLEEQRLLDCKIVEWTSRMLPVCNRLVSTWASSCLHPYLTGHVLITDPLNENPQLRHHRTLTITEALNLHADRPRPWLPIFPIHNDDDRGLPICLLARMSSCVYCGCHTHTLRHCPNPHALCHNQLGCIIPSNHIHYGPLPFCPAVDSHVVDDEGDYTNYVDAADDTVE